MSAAISKCLFLREPACASAPPPAGGRSSAAPQRHYDGREFKGRDLGDRYEIAGQQLPPIRVDELHGRGVRR